jgi:hypothetical protein
MARRRRLVATGALLVTAGAVAGGIWLTNEWQESPEPASSETGTSSGTSPQAAAQTTDAAFPEGAVPEDELPAADEVATDEPAPAPAADDVPVLVTYVGWDATMSAVEVSGLVDQVVDADGTCTATLTSGARVVTASGPATPDRTTTACGSVYVDGAELASGTWSAVLSFASADHSGSSAAVAVEVP